MELVVFAPLEHINQEVHVSAVQRNARTVQTPQPVNHAIHRLF